jgi:succinoglycan biosynthesis transport protein ExoP
VNLRQYLLIFRARYRLALVVMLATVAIAVPVILTMPRQYSATTSMVVDIRSPDPITALLMPATMTTQEDIIKSARVAQKVISLLKLDQDPEQRERWQADGAKGSFEMWLAERVQRGLTINPTRRDANTITIQYKAPDPRFAAAAANAFAEAYVEAMTEHKVEPAKQYARWFGEQGKSLRENLEAAEARLSEFLQKKGIVTKDETLDAETARLNELTSALTVVQAQTVDARSRQRAGAADALPELLGNTVVAGLRSDVARQEAKLKDASYNLGRNHPQYRSMEAELAELKARLAAETRHAASSFSAQRSVGSEKERELRAAIEAQKKKLLAIRNERDQLAVLQRDVDAAKNAYEAVEKRYTHTNIESQAAQTNVFLLRPATEPTEPSSPKPLRDTLGAILLGAVLGLGAAWLLEASDRRVRCADDVSGLQEMPVLVVIGRNSRGALPIETRPPPLALK